MRKAIFIALLIVAALVATEVTGQWTKWSNSQSASDNSRGRWSRQPNSDNSEELSQERSYRMDYDEYKEPRSPPRPFKAGSEYTFTYNTQIASGMVAPDTSGEPGMPQQKAVTRMQAQARIRFSSERHASLKLERIKLGQLNDKIPQPDTVKPMQIFEPKQIPQEKYNMLQLPCQFIYTDGVIERIQFHQIDETWSKNMKRAVLNMIQLNLKKNNAQGLRLPDDLYSGLEEEETQPGQPKAFTLPEVTVEGECQTMYTVTKMDEKNRFNVTKSLDFMRCRKIADVGYGFQTQQVQPQCSQCQLQWYKELQNQKSERKSISNPCDQCDPKEVKERMLSRSTVNRFVLEGDEKRYGFVRCELTSQYVYKGLKAETGEYSSAMHVIVANELLFQEERPISVKDNEETQSSQKDESLLMSNQWDVDEKRFYMYGDEMYSNNSPFKEVQNKAQQAEQALRRILQTVGNKAEGIEIDAPIQLQRFVELLRMASGQELDQIESACMTTMARIQQQQEKEMAAQYFYDALAIAGTRNTIAMLVEKILKREMSDSNAAQTLMSLQGLPAPSDSQIKLVLRLAQSEVAHRSERLRQTVWLMLGNMMNEVCQHKTQKNAQQTIYGSQSGFITNELCSLDKKQKYRDTLMEQYKNAETTYDKMVAILAVGNSGLDITVTELEEIITNRLEEKMVRIAAVEALRRLRTQMPRKIQSILMPLFLNNRVQPEIRIAAFSGVIMTLPDQQVVDQIAYALTKERSQHVLAFVYNSMKTLAKTKNPVMEQMAKHIQTALKLVNVDEKTLQKCGVAQLPIYSDEVGEGLFLNVMSASSPTSYMPVRFGVQLNSVLNDELRINDAALDFRQQNFEQLYEQVMGVLRSNTDMERKVTNTERMMGTSNSESQKDNFYNYITGEHRARRESCNGSEDCEQSAKEQPMAMINLRIGNVDKVFVPLGRRYGPEILMQIFGNQKVSLGQFASMLNMGKLFSRSVTMNMNEKRASIATSAGISLKAMCSTPVIANIEGEAKAQVDIPRYSAQAYAKVQASMNVAQMQKLQMWLPIFSTGVSSIRSFEINAPVDVEMSLNKAQGLQMKLKIPQHNVKLMGLHTLPTTFTADFDQNRKFTREPKIKAIHNPQINEFQREVDVVACRQLGIPIQIKGHYYRPAKFGNYKQFIQMLMAAENQVHVTLQPDRSTARELVIQIQASHFEKAVMSSLPKFENFYDNNERFSCINSEEEGEIGNESRQRVCSGNDEYEMRENHNERQEKLHRYLRNFQPGRMYKNVIRMSARTVGGEKQANAEMELGSTCDAKLRACKLGFNIERSAFFEYEGTDKWTLMCEADMVAPETVNSVDKLKEMDGRQQKFLFHSTMRWGPVNGNKQEMNVRIQGRKMRTGLSSKVEQQQRSKQSEETKAFIRHTAFLNTYQMEADYTLRPSAQRMFSRIFNAFKAKNFWNTKTMQLAQEQGTQNQGRVRAIFIIDPINQKRANLTVTTNTEMTRIETLELPMRIRPYPLVSNTEKSYHSISQITSRWEVGSRAQCRVDGRSVETFDGVSFSAPISKCYLVLAKDCTQKRFPRFTVLMKTMSEESGQMQIKVVTPEKTIECEPKDKDERKRQRLSCRIDGRPVEEHNNDIEDSTIQFNDDEKSDVVINVEGVSVRFNGRRALLKIAGEYKNGQCGLCGHYDGEKYNEFRMNNNEETQDMSKFHRSYSLQQDEECSPEEQNTFYQKYSKRFGRASYASYWSDIDSTRNIPSDSMANQRNQEGMQDITMSEIGNKRNTKDRQRMNEDKSSSSSSESMEKESEEMELSNSSEWTDSEKSRLPYSSYTPENYLKYSNYDSREIRSQLKSRRGDMISPRKQTAMMEKSSSKVCFSIEPVRVCPEGTYSMNDFGDSTESSEEKDNRQSPRNKKRGEKSKRSNVVRKIKFACMNRGTWEVRQFLNRYRNGEIIRELEKYSPTLTEEIPEPTMCRHF